MSKRALDDTAITSLSSMGYGMVIKYERYKELRFQSFLMEGCLLSTKMCVFQSRRIETGKSNGICCWGEFPHRHDKADANNMFSLCPLKCAPTKV